MRGGSGSYWAPSTTGTGRDAPMDAASNRFFWKIAIGVLVVGALLLVLAIAGY